MDWTMFGMQIIVALILAFIPAHIARKKGRSYTAWYFYGFLIWIVAIIHALVMKPRQPEQVFNPADVLR